MKNSRDVNCFTIYVSDGRPALEHIQHNHSYHLPPESSGAMQRPLTRDKLKGEWSLQIIESNFSSSTFPINKSLCSFLNI